MPLPFVKLQGAGNGYLAVDGRGAPRDWPALARAMGAPHFGVGSDGLLVVEDSERAPVRMRVFNTDGSEAEMSGNGIRLFAKFVIDGGFASPGDGGLQVETGAGLRTVFARLEAGRVVSARVAMGVPRVGSEAVLEVADRVVPVRLVDLGNPHAVVVLDSPVGDYPLAEVGPAVQAHSLFPERVNCEIVNVLAPDELVVRVFERGEGETLASGTGATAAAVAVRTAGRSSDEVAVQLPGGILRVGYAGGGEAWLEGPAVEVFRGVWPDQGRT